MIAVRRILLVVVLAAFALAFLGTRNGRSQQPSGAEAAAPHSAGSTNAPSENLPANPADRTQIAIDTMWVLIAGFLVMFMQAGFAMVETGLVRSRNVSHTTAMNLMMYSFAVLAFWLCGFAIMFGGGAAGAGGPMSMLGGGLLNKEASISLFGHQFGLFGHQGFLLTSSVRDASMLGLLAVFLFQSGLASTMATITTGAMTERWKFMAFVIFGVAMAAVFYPIYGNWVWGGGWLSQLGSNFGLGHGHVDFAGSSVVHLAGGVAAAVGCWYLGPRVGKYNRNGSVNVLIAHNAPMFMFGTLILAFGWFGFTGGHSAAGDLNIARVAVNTALASAGGAVASMIFLWRLYKKPDPSFICNGLLAGLVAISAPCAFVTPTAAVFIGVVAGVLVVTSVLFFERRIKLDDPVGAISVHGISGAWGVLALGLFADGTYGQGWNNAHLFRLPDGALKMFSGVPAGLPKGAIEQGVTGLFYGNASQLLAECIGLVAAVIWIGLTSLVVFWLIERFIGNRVSVSTEMQGLDIPELGVLGYVSEDPKPMSRSHSAFPEIMPPAPARPKRGESQFTIVVEGVEIGQLQAAWSELCRPSEKPPEADFLAIYPQFTTLKGNQFRFREGKPEELRIRLERLLKNHLPDRAIFARISKD